MIDVVTYKGHLVVDSFELYKLLGKKNSNYSRWVKRIIRFGLHDTEWFIDDDILRINKKIKARYYFSLSFASGISMTADKTKIIELRRFFSNLIQDLFKIDN